MDFPPAEPALRFGAFVLVLGVLLLAEQLWPLQRLPGHRRQGVNLALAVIDTAVLRLLLPLAAVGTAAWAQQRGFGLFNVVAIPALAAGVLSFLLLDFALYLQHRAMHAFPLLWRLHRVHHSDLALDATTGVRFHPLEIVASMLFKMALVLALGAPVAAVIAFEIVLNAGSLFSHANLRLAPALDARLRRLIVTPDMHRVHHSWHRDETDANFGFSFSFWDRLCGSYVAAPRDGVRAATIGLPVFREHAAQGLVALLAQPAQTPGEPGAV